MKQYEIATQYFTVTLTYMYVKIEIVSTVYHTEKNLGITILYFTFCHICWVCSRLKIEKSGMGKRKKCVSRTRTIQFLLPRLKKITQILILDWDRLQEAMETSREYLSSKSEVVTSAHLTKEEYCGIFQSQWFVSLEATLALSQSGLTPQSFFQ